MKELNFENWHKGLVVITHNDFVEERISKEDYSKVYSYRREAFYKSASLVVKHRISQYNNDIEFFEPSRREDYLLQKLKKVEEAITDYVPEKRKIFDSNNILQRIKYMFPLASGFGELAKQDKAFFEERQMLIDTAIGKNIYAMDCLDAELCNLISSNYDKMDNEEDYEVIDIATWEYDVSSKLMPEPDEKEIEYFYLFCWIEYKYYLKGLYKDNPDIVHDGDAKGEKGKKADTDLTVTPKTILSDLNQYGFKEYIEKTDYPYDRISGLILDSVAKTRVPYIIALLDIVKFISYLENNIFERKQDMVKKLSKIFKRPERFILGNINVLSGNSEENSTAYISLSFQETIKKQLKN